jgi:type IV pilus assembly protein PilV
MRRTASGFTLIEILVTLVILMIGLLGIAGLMAQGQRASFEAYQRQQALALANDMAERIKANRPGVDGTAVAATYADVVSLGTPAGTGGMFANLVAGTTTNCALTNCTMADVVAYDAALWDGLITGAAAETDRTSGDAIGPLLNPRGCVQTLPGASACPACGAGPPPPPASRQITYRVSVAWQGNYSTAAPDAGNTCGTGLYRDPVTNAADDNFRRLVFVDVYTVIPCACP